MEPMPQIRQAKIPGTACKVVAHSTKRGTEDTAVEIDNVGDKGLKKTEGTVKEIDRGGKKLVVKTGEGSEQRLNSPDMQPRMLQPIWQRARRRLPKLSCTRRKCQVRKLHISLRRSNSE